MNTTNQDQAKRELTAKQALELLRGTALVVIDDRPGSFSDQLRVGDVEYVASVDCSYEPNIVLKNRKGYYHHSRFALLPNHQDQAEQELREKIEACVRKALQDGAELMEHNRLFGGYKEIQVQTDAIMQLIAEAHKGYEPEAPDDLREGLIDKLDDQRFNENVVNKKLLYKDIEWIVDELLPVVLAWHQADVDRAVNVTLWKVHDKVKRSKEATPFEADHLLGIIEEIKNTPPHNPTQPTNKLENQ